SPQRAPPDALPAGSTRERKGSFTQRSPLDMNSDALGELDDSEIITARRKAVGAGAPAAADVPFTPLADVGVLLVHGIGNHREGVTLRAFGQPLLDWLK